MAYYVVYSYNLKIYILLGVVIYTCNPRTQQVKKGGSRAKVSLSYTVSPSLSYTDTTSKTKGWVCRSVVEHWPRKSRQVLSH